MNPLIGIPLGVLLIVLGTIALALCGLAWGGDEWSGGVVEKGSGGVVEKGSGEVMALPSGTVTWEDRRRCWILLDSMPRFEIPKVNWKETKTHEQ